MLFALLFVKVVHNFHLFAYVKVFLRPRDEFFLILMHDPFDVLLSLVC